jgi:MFS family permease
LHGGLTPYHVYEIAWFLHTNSDNEPFWKKREELHDESLRSLEAISFKLAHDWFGCRLPEEVEKETKSLVPKAQIWFERYPDSPLAGLLRPNKEALWLHLSLLKSPSDQRSVLFKSLFPALTRPAKDAVGWGARAYGKYLTHVISRASFHARALPGMLWHGLRWWLANDLGPQFWIFFAAFSLFDIGMSVFFFLYNLYLLDYGYTEKFLGQVTSANALGGIAGAIPAGIMAQRLGLRRTMLICLALLTLLSALLALIVLPVPQICLAFLASAASTAWSVCSLPATAQVTTERNRAIGFSLMMSSGIGFGVFAGLLGGNLPGWLGRIQPTATPGHLKQGALLVACAISGLAIWPTFRLRLGSAPAPEKKFYPRNPFIWRYLVALAAWSLVTGGFSPFFNAYFAQHVRMPLREIGLVSSASQIGTVLAILAAPVLFRKVGLIDGIAFSQIACAVALVWLAATSTMAGAAMTYVVFTALLWMSEPGMFSLLMDRVKPEEQSGASALNILVISLSGAVAGWLAGASFARYGYPAVMRVTAGVAIAAALMFRLFLRGSVGPRPAGFTPHLGAEGTTEAAHPLTTCLQADDKS